MPNGMVILAEPMNNVQSASFSMMIPCGTAVLPDGCCGAAAVISDWIFRGAGELDSRSLTDELDGLGLHRDSAIGAGHIVLSAACESGNIYRALELYADIILRPALKTEQFEFSRQLALHDLHALDDDPRQKVAIETRKHFYPDPMGRSAAGIKRDLENLTAQKVFDIVKDNFNTCGIILSVAGKCDFEKLCRHAEKLFNSPPAAQKQISIGTRKPEYVHIPHDGAQVHIGMMTPAVILGHRDYYNTMAAVSILGGSMSARLFTEVREKRGLCYAVGAGYHSLKEMAGITVYAGTTPEKAQQTFDVTIEQFQKITDGLNDDEVHRAKIGLKSSLIMQSESTIARASGIGSDYYRLGTVRPLGEIRQAVENISTAGVLDFLKRNPFTDFTVVTIGPKEINRF